jgi:excisionase family DNA binding protein
MEDVPLSISEVAERLGKSPDTVRRWIRSGHVAAVRPTPTSAYLIPVAELERLLGGGDRPFPPLHTRSGEDR